MTTKTVAKLNQISKILTTAFIADCRHGFTTENDVASIISETKYPTKLEIMKSMIRHDKHQIDTAFLMMGISSKISNILKTPRQLDYIAGNIVESLMRCKDESVKALVGKTF